MLDLPTGGRRYLQIARMLAERIDAGEYPSGQKLPPERELAVMFDVSRTTVREALLALEIMRFIEIRVGAGVYVLSESQRDTGTTLETTGEVGPYQVLEARRMVEGQTAYYAAERARPEEIAAIAAVVERMDSVVDDVPAYDVADAEYHALIATASGNELLQDYVAHLWRMRRSSLWNRWYDSTRSLRNRRRTIEDHRAILKALQRRNPEAAKTAMQQHIDTLADRFLELKL